MSTTSEHDSLFRRRLVWVACIGIWPNATTSRIFGMSEAMVKEVKAARREPYSSFQSNMHADAYDYARRYIPRWLVEGLDSPERCDAAELRRPTTPEDSVAAGTPNEFFTWLARRLFAKQAQMNDRMRRGLLFEANRVRRDGAPLHKDIAFYNGFGLARIEIDRLRGRASRHVDYFAEVPRRKQEFLSTVDANIAQTVAHTTLPDAEKRMQEINFDSPAYEEAARVLDAVEDMTQYIEAKMWRCRSGLVESVLNAAATVAFDVTAAKIELRRVKC